MQWPGEGIFILFSSPAIFYESSHTLIPLLVFSLPWSVMPVEWLESWVFRLLQNLVGYATVAVPGAFLVHYLKDSKFLDVTGKFRPHSVIFPTYLQNILYFLTFSFYFLYFHVTLHQTSSNRNRVIVIDYNRLQKSCNHNHNHNHGFP